MLRFRAFLFLGPVLLALLLLSTTAALAASSCGGTSWYGSGNSGTGAVGTDVWMSTPSTWSIADNTSTSAASSWLLQGDPGHANIALEAGWYSGYFPYAPFNVDRTHLIPYYTENNGPLGCVSPQCKDNEADVLPLGTGFHFTVRQGNPGGYTEIGWGTSYDWMVPQNYPVLIGRNYMQGEVRGTVSYPTSSWMGNGPSPHSFQMNGYYCIGACTSWGSWGFINVCHDYPFTAISQGQSSATDYISGPNW